MVNRVTIIGNLGRDPEIRTLDDGTKVARISVASNENYRDNSGEWQTVTEWHNIVLWRNLAERAQETLSKGALVYFDGKLSSRTYDKDGTSIRVTEIVANYFRRLDKNNREQDFPTAADAPKEITTAEQKKKEAPPGEFTKDDDLPF